MFRQETLIFDAAGDALLLERGGGVPAVEAEPYAHGEVADLLDAVRTRIGIEAVMLLCVRSDAHGQRHLLQAVRPCPAPHGTEWVSDLSAADGWREAVADGIPWARPGWIAETCAWVEAQVGERLVDWSQRRAWEFSCLLDLRGRSREWILKCLPRPFAREVGLLRRMAELAPASVPRIAAADGSRQCVLMERNGGTPLAEVDDLDAWRLSTARYAAIQIDWIERAGELVDLGLPERPLDRLVEDMHRLLVDEDAMLAGEPDGLSSAEVRRLRRRAVEIETRCRALAAFAIPATIEHGDLWEENILVEKSGPIFLDWTDASVAHPFFSLCPMFAGDIGRAERDALRNSYLEPWRKQLPKARVDEAFDVAQLPAAMHHAVNYHRFILPMVRTERSARRLLPFYLRRLLAER